MINHHHHHSSASIPKSASSSTVDSSTNNNNNNSTNDDLEDSALGSCGKKAVNAINNNEDEEELADKSSQPNGLTGLQNIGNTCYMNAALQALSNCPPLTNYFQTCGAVACRFVERRQSVARCFAQLIEDIWSKQHRAVVDPSNLAAQFRTCYPAFRLHTQQDAQEFLRCFLDRLHEELSEPTVCFLDTAASHIPVASSSVNTNSNDSGQQQQHQVLQNCCTITSSLSSAPTANNCLDAAANIRLNEEPNANMQSSLMTTSQATSSDCSSNDLFSVPASQSNGMLLLTSSSLNNTNSALEKSGTNDSFKYVKLYSDVSTDYETADDDMGDEENQNDDDYEVVDDGDVMEMVPPDLIPVEESTALSLQTSSTSGLDSSQSHLHISNPPQLFRRNLPSEACAVQQQQVQSPTRSIISDLFDGQIRSCVKCLTCGNISQTKERFQDLSLPIPSYNDLLALRRQSQGQTSTHSQMANNNSNYSSSWLSWIKSWLSWGGYRGSDAMPSVNDCLSAFFVADELKGDDMYSCSHCAKLRNGIRYAELISLPELLCIHLKRFRHDINNGVSKIKQHVVFPLNGLDLRPYMVSETNTGAACVGTTLYDLVAIVQHDGVPAAGHYTAICLNENTGLWYEYDDDCVTSVPLEKVLRTQAYVLFYRRRPALESGSIMRHLASLMTNSVPGLARTFLLSAEWRERVLVATAKSTPSPSRSRRHHAKRARGSHYNSLGHHVKDKASVLQKKRSLCEADLFPPSLLVFYVSKNWLVRLRTFSAAGPISNYDFLCEHGAVQPRCFSIVTELVEPVPEPAWQYLHDMFGGGPACNKLYECHWCRKEAENIRARQIHELETYRRLENATATIESVSTVGTSPPKFRNSGRVHKMSSSSGDHAADGKCSAGTQYAIAMVWWRRWRAFVTSRSEYATSSALLQTNSCGLVMPPGPIDNMPIATPVSPQNCSNPNLSSYQLRGSSADYASINEATWRFLLGIYGGGPEVPIFS